MLYIQYTVSKSVSRFSINKIMMSFQNGTMLFTWFSSNLYASTNQNRNFWFSYDSDWLKQINNTKDTVHENCFIIWNYILLILNLGTDSDIQKLSVLSTCLKVKVQTLNCTMHTVHTVSLDIYIQYYSLKFKKIPFQQVDLSFYWWFIHLNKNDTIV